MSGWPTPTPAQNSLKPPPVPVDSTTGVLKLPVLPNCSATAVENGNTVLEPTMRIWSRASAAEAAKASDAKAAMARVRFLVRYLPLPRFHGCRPNQPIGRGRLHRWRGPQRVMGAYLVRLPASSVAAARFGRFRRGSVLVTPP